MQKIRSIQILDVQIAKDRCEQRRQKPTFWQGVCSLGFVRPQSANMCQAPKPPKSLRCINQFNQPQQISVWKAEGEARQLVLGLRSVSAHKCTYACVYIYIHISLSLYLSLSLSLSLSLCMIVCVYNKRNVPAQGVGTSLPAPGARISSARAMDCSDYAKLHRHKFERYTGTTPPDPQQFLARRFTSWGNTWQMLNYLNFWKVPQSPYFHIFQQAPTQRKKNKKS